MDDLSLIEKITFVCWGEEYEFISSPPRLSRVEAKGGKERADESEFTDPAGWEIFKEIFESLDFGTDTDIDFVAGGNPDCPGFRVYVRRNSKRVPLSATGSFVSEADGKLLHPSQLEGFLSPIHYKKVLSAFKLISGADNVHPFEASDTAVDLTVHYRNTENLQKTFRCSMRVSLLPSRGCHLLQVRFHFDDPVRYDLKRLFHYDQFRNLLLLGIDRSKSSGLILIGGPTSSGKTTTAYALLSHLTSPLSTAYSEGLRSVVSMEHPIEKPLREVTQVEIEPERGLSFRSALTFVLRHDPDVIFVGEIRDKDSARTAVRAAATGHLVIATIHCSNVKESINRLAQLGVKRDEIVMSLRLLINQRILPKVCPDCAVVADEPFPPELVGAAQESNLDPKVLNIVTGNQCESCSNGFKGIVAAVEALIPNTELREWLKSEVATPPISGPDVIPMSAYLNHLVVSGQIDYKTWEHSIESYRDTYL